MRYSKRLVADIEARRVVQALDAYRPQLKVPYDDAARAIYDANERAKELSALRAAMGRR